MKDNLFLRWWYRFGALLCIFPWNPENGKVYVQSVASIFVISASIAPAYLEAKSYSNAVDSLIFASLIILSYFVFNLTHFYGLVKERNIWKKHHDLLFCLNTLIDCTVYVSITKILWFVTLWVIMLSLALYSNLRLWSSTSYFSIYLGFYWLFTVLQMFAFCGFLLEISLILKTRGDLLCNSIKILFKHQYCKNEVFINIKTFSKAYKYIVLTVLNLNHSFGKKILIFIIFIFQVFIGNINFALNLYKTNNINIIPTALYQSAYLFITMVSFVENVSIQSNKDTKFRVNINLN